MKRIRHRLGRWLLRDAPKPEVRIVGADTSASDIHRLLLSYKNSRGGGSLGLS
jgi:hypothetical protein